MPGSCHHHGWWIRFTPVTGTCCIRILQGLSVTYEILEVIYEYSGVFHYKTENMTITFQKWSVNMCPKSQYFFGGPGGLMSWVVGLPNYSYKPITNTAWVPARLWNLHKGCTRLATTSDKVYQLLAHGRWFSPDTPASSTTKTGRHNIAEILLNVALNTINQIKPIFFRMFHAMSWRLPSASTVTISM
jgi:hypothetical protein